MTRMSSRMNMWAEVVKSPYFDIAVAVIKRHGCSTNTTPGISKSICRDILMIDFRTSKASDVAAFMEMTIAGYNQEIEEIVKGKREKVEKLATKEVVVEWTAHYSKPHADSKLDRKRKIRFHVGSDFHDSYETMKSVSSFEVDSESENSLADPGNVVAEVEVDKSLHQKQAAFDALEKLAMLEESFRNPTRGNKRVKSRH